jgi:hypothetical protein
VFLDGPQGGLDLRQRQAREGRVEDGGRLSDAEDLGADALLAAD